jgi:pimeloyl-ACP methyl ester carboxylesterase
VTTTVLIHGIWMNGWEMSLLRHRLRKAGFDVVQFSYPSVTRDLRANARMLQEFLKTIDDGRINMVAHSLGGLLVRRLFFDFPGQKPGRIVTLGTPHGGSFVARQMNKHIVGRLLFGKSLRYGLLGDAPPWESDHELGVIAGDRGVGVGRVITRLPKPNDGTVPLEETSLQGMTDYKIVPVNHMGLMFSKSVANQVMHFLTQGRFKHEE